MLTLCVHLCSTATYSLNEKENLKKMKSQQDPESGSFVLETELELQSEIMKDKGKKEKRGGNDYFILDFSRQWSQATSYISVSNLCCLRFCPCSVPVGPSSRCQRSSSDFLPDKN